MSLLVPIGHYTPIDSSVLINGNPTAQPYADIPANTSGIVTNIKCGLSFKGVSFNKTNERTGLVSFDTDLGTDYVVEVEVEFKTPDGTTVRDTVKPSHVIPAPQDSL